MPSRDKAMLQAAVLRKYRGTLEGQALDAYINRIAAANIQPPPQVVIKDLSNIQTTNAPQAAKSIGGLYGSSPVVPGGIIALDPRAARRANAVGTLAHETVHAAQDRMGKQVNDAAHSSPEFKSAYRKLGLDSTALAKAISDSWVKTDREVTGSKYRTTAPELAAFGVGNSITSPAEAAISGDINAAPPHVDATAAQEFMILLDLATRNIGRGGPQQ